MLANSHKGLWVGVVVFTIMPQLSLASEDPIPPIDKVEAQPLLAQISRLQTALNYLGTPLPTEATRRLKKITLKLGDRQVTKDVQEILDDHCLVVVDIKKNGQLRVRPMGTDHPLIEQGWRTYLIKVQNRAGITSKLKIESPNAQPIPNAPKEELPHRWFGLAQMLGQPLLPNLSGLRYPWNIVLSKFTVEIVANIWRIFSFMSVRERIRLSFASGALIRGRLIGRQ